MSYERITALLEHAKAVRHHHHVHGRHIDAAAAEIRVQAFREVLAIMRGEDPEPNRVFQQKGKRNV